MPFKLVVWDFDGTVVDSRALMLDIFNRLAAEFRADTAARSTDRAVSTLVNALCEASPRFEEFWNDQSVLARDGGTREFNPPQDGRLRFEQVTFVPAARSGYKLVMLLTASDT